MSKRTEMALTKRLLIGFGIVTFWVIVMTVLNGTQALLSRSSEARLNDSVQRLDTANRVNALSQAMDLRTQLLGYSSESITLLAGIQSGLERDATSLTDLLGGLTGSVEVGSAEATDLDSIAAALVELQQSTDAFFSAARSGATELNSALSRSLRASEALRQLTDTYQQSMRAVHGAELDHMRWISRLFLIINIIVGIFAVIGSVFAGWGTSRLAKRRLNEAASGVGTAASELMAVAAQVAASATQTAASTNETTVTVEEVRQTAMLAHEKASQMSQLSQDVTQTAESGLAAVNSTLEGLDRMQSEMDLVITTIAHLSDKTQDVGDIVTAVNDLAEQSNLLSVNASIEAAKAGEYGKGFTVVAQEVKNLALQSKQAVEQIRHILDEIIKATKTAVEAAESSGKAMESGRGRSRESGTAIETLYANTDEAAQVAAQVSASSQQQLAGMDQISAAIQGINEASVQSVAGTKQVEQEIEHLKALALDLKLLVDAKTKG